MGVSADKARPLGEWLRQRREELGISLEQAEADTRIRRCYLEALESEKFDALPDAVVGRGFLRNYAVYLELDPKAASDRYSESVAPPQPESLAVEGPTPFTEEPFRPVALHQMPGRRSRWVWIAGAVLILVAALSLLGWWGYPRFSGWLTQREPANSPVPVAATSTQQGELPTATHTPSSIATATSAESEKSVQATPTLELTQTPTTIPSPSLTPSPPVYTGIFLELVFSDTSWIQVTVDGVREFQGELEAETYRSWYGEERIELRIGNAGAVLVTVNGQSLGTLGGPDEVVDRVFEKVDGGVAEATVTSTPTVTQTTEPTETATTRPTAVPPTATIAPTEPIRPTATITPTVAITATASP